MSQSRSALALIGSAVAILMLGARGPGTGVLYQASEVAARHGVSVAHDTWDPQEAHRGWPEIVPARFPWPPERGAADRRAGL